MNKIIFYSWQSDLPNTTNRSFIQDSLKKASAEITADDTLNIEPVMDRDTQGMSGAPDISSAIFSKISSADIFVADVSIINDQKVKRPTPNPNVLVELGYALKALGHERIILVFNENYGKIESLPFDIRTRRSMTYKCSENETERNKKKNELKKDLKKAILTAIESISSGGDSLDNPIKSVEAIENQKPNKTIILRRDLKNILEEIVENEPKKPRDGGTIDDLKKAIERTKDLVEKFSRIAESIAIMKDKYSALEVYKWFGGVIEKYNIPKGFSGSYHYADHDYFKFVGHELFTTLIAFLQKEQQWAIIGVLLSESIEVKYLSNYNGPGHLSWSYISSYLYSSEIESKTGGRSFIQADTINDRHTRGKLSEIMPLRDFVDTDFLLYLISESFRKNEFEPLWYPRSIFYLEGTPMFIKKGSKKHIAEKIAKTFKLNSAEELQNKLLEISHKMGESFDGRNWKRYVSEDEIKKIGTE